MDKKKLESFKKRLETRQQDLRRTVNRTQADERRLPRDEDHGVQAHRRPRRQFLHQGEFLFQPKQQPERQLLQMVDTVRSPASAKAASGECAHRGKEINAKRLEAVPLDAPLHRVPGKNGAGTAGRSSAVRTVSRSRKRRREIGGVRIYMQIILSSCLLLLLLMFQCHFAL